MTHFTLLVSILAFGCVHSLTAADFLTNKVQSKYYRLGYNGLSVVSILVVFYCYQAVEIQYLFEAQIGDFLPFFLIGLGFSGVLMVLWGYDLLEFSGFDAFGEKKTTGKLKTDGFLTHVRHPLYTAIILILIGFFLQETSLRNAIVGVVFTVYILIGIHFEERKLIRIFGEAYSTYKAKTPMLIPWLKF